MTKDHVKMHKAELEKATKNPKQALKTLLEINLKNLDIYDRQVVDGLLFELYHDSAKYLQCLKIIDQHLKRNPENASEIVYSKAHILVHLKRYKDAIKILKKIEEKISPGLLFGVYREFVVCYVMLERFNEARSYFSKLPKGEGPKIDNLESHRGKIMAKKMKEFYKLIKSK